MLKILAKQRPPNNAILLVEKVTDSSANFFGKSLNARFKTLAFSQRQNSELPVNMWICTDESG